MEEEIKKEIIGKAGFPLYSDYWEKYFVKMSGEQVKECLKIIFHFNSTFEVLATNDLGIDFVVVTIIDNLKRDAQKRIKQSKASRENGKQGGRPSKYEAKTKQKVSKPEANDNNNLNQDHESEFELFWQSYKPIHVGKGNKEKSKQLFLKAIKKESVEDIKKGLASYMNHCHSKNSYTKSVEVWLRNESWKDEQITQLVIEQKNPKQDLRDKINAPKPSNYTQIMNIAANFIKADYRFCENNKFYFLAENELEKKDAQTRQQELEIELFRMTNSQASVIITSKDFLND